MTDEFYAGPEWEPDELRALAVASVMDGVDAELAVLRVLIRQLVRAGDVDGVRRATETLGRLLQVRLNLSKAGAERLETALDRVLDALAAEEALPR